MELHKILNGITGFQQLEVLVPKRRRLQIHKAFNKTMFPQAFMPVKT
jgi:hypothetical protein